MKKYLLNQLFECVEGGDLARLRSLIKGGVDLSARDRDGRDALMVASINSTECIPILVSAGAGVNNVDNQSRTALMMTSWSCILDASEELIAAGADVDAVNGNGTSILSGVILSSFARRAEMIGLLVSNGATIGNDEIESATMISEMDGGLSVNMLETELCRRRMEAEKPYVARAGRTVQAAI